MQPGVTVFGRAKTNYIIAKHVYTRRFLRDRSFLEVFILDRAWPVLVRTGRLYITLSYDPYGLARAFIAKLLRKSP